MLANLRLFTITFALLLPLGFVGCAAPGSALTRPSLRGRLIDAHGRGIPNKRVDLMLPSTYGLAGLDAVWGKPEAYGHKQQVATVQTDNDGRFTHLFQPTTYSIVLFLLPPLGIIPSQPPKPFFALRTTFVRPDSYVIGWNQKTGLDYRVWNHETGVLRQDSGHKINGAFTLQEIPVSANNQYKLKGWQTDITVMQP